ncbi:MAG: 3-hydroxybutyryl-CoA dehydrogenase [Thermoanaerobaculia bacterium]
MHSIQTIGVIGAGTMGNGIAQVAAGSGFEVRLVDSSTQALEQGLGRIDKGLARLESKEKISADEKEKIRSRIVGSTDISAVADVDLVVEAIVEKLDIKSALFTELDRICAADTILASNTSSISITRLAAMTGRAGRVIGMHFMNPVPVMKLVEIIRGLATDQGTYDKVEQVAKTMGKTPVEVHDAPGFVSNRVLMPMINEAIFCLHEGVGDARAIDEVMRLGMNHPMGPLALADLIGLDVCLDILRVLHHGFADSKYRPCPLLIKMVDAGYLGRKSGRGFYTYGDDESLAFHPSKGYL